MALIFPETSVDLGTVFDNAIAAGVMQRDNPDKTDYWARFEFLAHDTEDGTDVFYNALSGQYPRVPRTEESE